MNKLAKISLQIILFVFPWAVRRHILNWLFGYDIKRGARIGYSIVLCKHLRMADLSRIGNFNFINRIDKLELNEDSGIGSLNYVTGFPTGSVAHFGHKKDRSCALVMRRGSGITSRHFVDCTFGVTIGELTTVAGIGSLLLTHSIDVRRNRQDGASIEIGTGCFLGAKIIVLPGVVIADRVVIAAGSVIYKSITENDAVYGSHNLRQLTRLNAGEFAYAQRTKSNVD